MHTIAGIRYNRTMKKFMVADLVKAEQLYPSRISFDMNASGGSWKGTFARDNATATITATHLGNGTYRVILRTPSPYPGPYEYQMPYDILTQWESNANNASFYNTNIKGNTAYFPK